MESERARAQVSLSHLTLFGVGAVFWIMLAWFATKCASSAVALKSGLCLSCEPL